MTVTNAPPSTDELIRELTRIDPERGARLLGSAPLDDAVEAVRDLESEHQAAVLEWVEPSLRDRVIARMPPDERARLLAETDDTDAWLRGLAPDDRATTLNLLNYPPESVGRMMTPRVLELHSNEPITAALDRVRRCEAEVDTVYRLPVTDGGRLVGMVELRDLLGAAEDALVGDVTRDARDTALQPYDDQEVGARRVLSTETLAVPVVNADQELLGLVTFDDAMEVLQLEETEDVARSSGADPLGRPYLAASLFRLVQTRAVWLVLAAAAGVVTVRVLDYFEAQLEQVVALALFIPLLLGTGGNIGAQAATTVVRAMAVDDLRLVDLPRVVWREAGVGITLGGLLAVLAVMPISIVYEPRLAAVVSLTLVSVCVIGTSAGSMLPLGVGRFGADPAVISAPLITTLVDATGLLVYFGWARLIFDI